MAFFNVFNMGDIMKKLKLFAALLITIIFGVLVYFNVSAKECEHIDEDGVIDICDMCYSYLWDTDLVVGTNYVIAQELSNRKPVRFIPSEDGYYLFIQQI